MGIEHLAISPGHNYFGRFGHGAGSYPIQKVHQLECVAGRGIRGDRFFDYKPDYKGQITFFAMETYEAMLAELSIAVGSPMNARRNVYVRGLDLTSLVGTEFELQGVRFRGMEECKPCFWMNEAFGGREVEAWMKGRGGLRAIILTAGTLRTGTVDVR